MAAPASAPPKIPNAIAAPLACFAYAVPGEVNAPTETASVSTIRPRPIRRATLARSIDKPPIAYGAGNLTADAATTCAGCRLFRFPVHPTWADAFREQRPECNSPA